MSRRVNDPLYDFEWQRWIPEALLADRVDIEEHLALQHTKYTQKNN